MRSPKSILVAILACGFVGSGAYGLASAGTQPHGSAAASGDAAATKLVRVPWAPVALGGGGRLLTIRYRSAPCSVAGGRVELTPSAGRIAIRVVQPVTTSPGVSCTADATFPKLHVHLRSPLNGRVLAGGVGVLGPLPAFRTITVRDAPRPDVLLPLVPGVVGFRVRNALDVLRGDGLRARVQGGRGQVTAQRPRTGRLAPGTTPAHPFSGVVTLVAQP
jgi:hypothetical protein